MNDKEKYKVYDSYEGTELIGYADNIKDAKAIAKNASRTQTGSAVFLPKNGTKKRANIKLSILDRRV